VPFATAPVICSEAEYSTRPPTAVLTEYDATNTDPAERACDATDPPGPNSRPKPTVPAD